MSPHADRRRHWIVAALPAILLFTPPADAQPSGPGRNRTPSGCDGYAFHVCPYHIDDPSQPRSVAVSHGYGIEHIYGTAASLTPYPTVTEAREMYESAGIGFLFFNGHGSEGGLQDGCQIIDMYPPTSDGRLRRDAVYDSLIATWNWEEWMISCADVPTTGGGTAFYGIGVEYDAVAWWTDLAGAIVHNECCYGGDFTDWTGARCGWGPPGTITQIDTWHTCCDLYNGLDGRRGIADRTLGRAIEHANPSRCVAWGDMHTTLSPAIKWSSARAFAPVPPGGLDVRFLFDTRVNTVIDAWDCLAVNGNLQIEAAVWVNDTTFACTIGPGPGEIAAGDLYLLGTIQSYDAPCARLDGDGIWGGGDDHALHLGPDDAAGLAALSAYDGTRVRLDVERAAGVARFELQGRAANGWQRFATIAPQVGTHEIETPRTYEEVRLLEHGQQRRPTLHGSIAHGHRPGSPRAARPTLTEAQAELRARIARRSTAERDFPGAGSAIAIVAPQAWWNTLAPLADYLARQDVEVRWIDAEAAPPGAARRSAIRVALVDLWAQGVEVAWLVGDANDHEVWSSPWPASWEEIRQDYIAGGCPAAGEPERDIVPTFYISDPDPCGINTAWFTPYVPSDDLYADMDIDPDGLPDLVLARLPVTEELDLAIYLNKLVAYLELAGQPGVGLNLNIFVGDEDYDNPGDGRHAAEMADSVLAGLPPETLTRRICQSDTTSLALQQMAIAMIEQGAAAHCFFGPNASRNNWASILWKDLFSWDLVDPSWAGVICGCTCGMADFSRTQPAHQRSTLLEDALCAHNKGAVMSVASCSGTWSHPLARFWRMLIDRVTADRSTPIARHVLAVKRACAEEMDPGEYLTVQSIACLGFPLAPLNALVYATGVAASDPREAELLLTGRPTLATAGVHVGFELPRPARARLRAFDVAGRQAGPIQAQTLAAGPGQILWPGLDGRGRPLPAGVYHLVLSADDRHGRLRVHLLR